MRRILNYLGTNRTVPDTGVVPDKPRHSHFFSFSRLPKPKGLLYVFVEGGYLMLPITQSANGFFVRGEPNEVKGSIDDFIVANAGVADCVGFVPLTKEAEAALHRSNLVHYSNGVHLPNSVGVGCILYAPKPKP